MQRVPSSLQAFQTQELPLWHRAASKGSRLLELAARALRLRPSLLKLRARRIQVLTAPWAQFAFCLLLSILVASAMKMERLNKIDPDAYLSNPRPRRSFVYHASEDVPSVTVVTAASAEFFAALQNFVASMQHWAPELKVVVYDLGLAPEQAAAARCWAGVAELLPFDFESRAPHFRRLGNFAWKLAAIEEALRRYGGAVLFQDAGQEARGPLSEVAADLWRRGHLLVGIDSPAWQTHPGMFEALGVDRAAWPQLRGTMVAGGLLGFKAGSAAAESVLARCAACAREAACIEGPAPALRPRGPLRVLWGLSAPLRRLAVRAGWALWDGDRQYDQACVTIAAREAGLPVDHSHRFLVNERTPFRELTEAEVAARAPLLFSRRHRPLKPFGPRIRLKCDPQAPPEAPAQ
eukprot:tig00000718_g3706.t1